MFRIHTVLHQTFARNENGLRTTLLSPTQSRDRFFFPRPSSRESQASMPSFARRLARQTCSQMSRWLAAACRTAALTAEAWHQVHYGSMAVRRWCLAAIHCMHWDAACRHWETVIILSNTYTPAFVISFCDGVCLVFIPVPAVSVWQRIWF